MSDARRADRDVCRRCSREVHVKRRIFGSAAIAGLVMVFSLVSFEQIALTSAGSPADGQGPAAAKNWTPPRLADGHPDLQGFWDGAGTSGSYYLEERPATDSATGRATKSQVIDPPDGKVP